MDIFRKLPAALLLIFPLLLSAQHSPKTTLFDFSQQKVFIENKGQFTNPADKSGKILFAYDGGPSKIYFTATGLVYSFTKVTVKKDADKGNSIGEEEEEENSIKTQSDMVSMQWEGCNPNCRIIAEDKSSDYYSYYTKENGKENDINNIYGYKKLTYKNLYPGIDVEYIFNPIGGVEYSLVIQPGADILSVKMKYSGKNPRIDRKGNVHIKTAFGDIIDHAPSRCINDVNNPITYSWFKMTDENTVSFGVANYHPNYVLTIDPWTITPSFPNSGKIWNCQTDALGNVYLYGGDSPLLLKKFNSTGTLQWTYTTPWDSSTYWLGSLITDRAGESYITSGANGEISKITTAGALVWHNNPNGLFGPLYEYWHLAFNCDQTQLVVGGTELPSPINIAGFRGEIFNINLTNGDILNQVVVGWTTGLTIKEVRTICSSPNGNFYWLTLDSVGCITPGFVVTFKNVSTYNFAYGSPSYAAVGNLGQNNIRATLSNIYTQNGTNVNKRDITNGNILATATIPGGGTNAFLGTYSPDNSGLDIDSCGNVYVGSTNQVVEYDANLNQLNTVTTPSAVYDVAVNNNGEVIACGDGFAMSISFGACLPPAPICKVCTPPTLTNSDQDILCYGNATGTATANVTGINPPYTYTWSPSGGTNSTATGLTAGTYTCTVTDNSGCSASTVVSVTQPLAITSTITPVATNCGGNTGSASSSVAGGTGAYTYSWSPSGGNGANASGLSAGNYSLTITDNNGCTLVSTTTITTTGGPAATLSKNDILCYGNSTGTANATVSGGTSPYTYSWLPGGNSNSSLSGLGAGTYTCIVTDANGCASTTTVSITQPLAITATITPASTSCGNNTGSASAIASGGTGTLLYSWSPAGGTNANASGLSAGTYTLTITDANSCSYTNSTVINSSGGPTVNSTQTNLVCNGNNTGTATANVTGGTSPFTYSWSPAGGSNATATGLSAGTYTCIITDANGCISSIILTITEPTAITITLKSDTICNGNSASFAPTISGGTLPYTYLWTPSTNLSCTSCIAPVASPTSSTCYTLTVTDSGGCALTSRACVRVNPLPDLTLIKQSTDTVCNTSAIVQLFGSPSGGVFGGKAVYGHFFYPDSAFVNRYNVFSYTYTDTNTGCTAVVKDSIYVAVCEGVNNIAGANGGVQVYPNPNNGQFVIQLSVVSSQLSVEIYDVLGQIITAKELKTKTTRLNLSNKADGVYFYRVIKSDGSMMGAGKMVIEK